MSYSPYTPPADAPSETYRSLGFKTIATTIAIVLSVVLGLSVAIASMMKPMPQNPAEVDGATLGVLGLATITQFVSIAAGVIFLLWHYQAAKNVRGYGHEGLEYSPGMCVVWWIIPIASLWKPYQAMKEVWLASDPEHVGGGESMAWRRGRVPGMFPLWWATYIGGGFIALIGAGFSTYAQIVKSDTSIANVVGIVGQVLVVVSAVAIVSIMKQIDRRQAECARRLRG